MLSFTLSVTIFGLLEAVKTGRVHSITVRPDSFTTLFVGVDVGANQPGLYKLEKHKDKWRTTKGPIDLQRSSIFYDMETGTETGDIYVAIDIGLFVIDQYDNVTVLKTFPKSRSAVEVHPKNENIIYLAYDRGEVLKSVNRGKNWEKISLDIPTQGFVMLKVDPNYDTVYVEGPGSGIWKKAFVTLPE